MYKDFEGKKVSIIVSSRGGNILRYDGTLEKAGETVILSEANISILTAQFGRNVFGSDSSIYTIMQGVLKTSINPENIISVQNK